MKKIFIAILFSLSFLGSTSAQGVINCKNNFYAIDGYENIKKDQFVEYSIRTLDGDKPLLLSSITYKVFDKDKLLDTFNAENYATYFKSLGIKKLQVDFVDGNGCKYRLSKDVNVYNNLIVYIGDDMNEFQLGFDENFRKHSILFNKVILNQNTYLSNEDLIGFISDSVGYLKSADKIIISSQIYDRIFDVFHKLVKSDLMGISKKDIYIIADDNKLFIKRIITKYLKLLKSPNVSVVESDYLLNFLSSLSFDKMDFDDRFVYNISSSPIGQSKYYLLSSAVDYLIYQGMSVNFLSFLLVLSICILIISLLRQFVGFSIFGLFYPLMFSISLLLVGIKLSLLLLLMAFISTIATKLFLKKIYLLHNAKIALLMIFYVCLLILLLTLDHFMGFNMINFTSFDNMFMIFPLVFVAIIGDKIFNEGFRLFSFGSLFSLAEFLLVSFVSYFLFSRSGLRHLMISYPEIIIIVFVLNLFIGRFTGLQILEYFRFIPLIKRQFEEE